MVAVYYTKGNTKYTINKCTEIDIESDYEYVRDLVDDVPEDVYKQRMLQSVQEQYAYRVYKDTTLVGFIYTIIENNHGEGVSIYGKDTIGFILLFKEVFTDFPSHKLLVAPHYKNNTYLKSITLGRSIRDNHNYGAPLVIILKDAIKKFTKVYHKLGIINECSS